MVGELLVPSLFGRCLSRILIIDWMIVVGGLENLKEVRVIRPHFHCFDDFH